MNTIDFTINGHRYTNDPIIAQSAGIPPEYQFIGYSAINALANYALDVVAVGGGSTGQAEAFAILAQQAAAIAQASADTSVNAAAGFQATSSTMNTVGIGLKTYVIEANKSFFPGMFVVAISASDRKAYNTGQVYSCDGTNLIIDGQAAGVASGSFSDWVIGPSGPQGAPGPVGSLAGTNMTGPLNTARAPDVASALTTDIWSGAGNFMVLTGDESIASFGTAPQPGADRDILVAGHPILLSSATLSIKGVRAGRTLALAPGDELSIRAKTTSIIRITVTRADGSSPSDRSRTHSALLSF